MNNTKKYITGVSLIGLLLTLYTVSFAETEIEIKGVKIGMDKELCEKITTSNMTTDFTIAGIYAISKFYPVTLDFNGDKLDRFTFLFNSSDFDTMLDAVKSKYTDLKCVDSVVTNNFGAEFDNKNCQLQNTTTVLNLIKYIDLKTSALSLTSHEYIKKYLDKKNERNKDL